MMLVGWFSDLPAIASSGEAGGIAQETISFLIIIMYRKNCPKWINRLLLKTCPTQTDSKFKLQSTKGKYFSHPPGQ
jgi:hypothetical protein